VEFRLLRSSWFIKGGFLRKMKKRSLMQKSRMVRLFTWFIIRLNNKSSLKLDRLSLSRILLIVVSSSKGLILLEGWECLKDLIWVEWEWILTKLVRWCRILWWDKWLRIYLAIQISLEQWFKEILCCLQWCRTILCSQDFWITQIS
jgi:hypothetical protein